MNDRMVYVLEIFNILPTAHLILDTTVVAPGQITLMNSLMSSSPSPLTSPTANRASISLSVNLEPDLRSSSCTILYCTVLYCTVLYCTVLYCTVARPAQLLLAQHAVTVVVHLLEQEPSVVNVIHILIICICYYLFISR